MNQLRVGGFIQFVLEVGILYNLFQLIRQSNTVYFLAYKLFFIIYLGCWLVYLDLDIYAIFIWMIYGSFIAIVFVFLLMWTDVTRAGEELMVVRFFLWGGFGFAAVIYIFCTNISSWGAWVELPLFFTIHINFYEFLIMDFSGELEVLGWGFGFDNMGGLICCGVILTLACFVVVTIILNARRLRALVLDNSSLVGSLDERYFKHLTLKLQNIWLQERDSVGVIRRIFKISHNRRI